MKKISVTVFLILALMAVVLSVSCDHNPNPKPASAPSDRGAEVTESQWVKAFSSAESKAVASMKSDKELIDKYGFCSSTVQMEAKAVAGGKGCSYTEKTLFGNGFICSETTVIAEIDDTGEGADIKRYMSYSDKSNKWYYNVILSGDNITKGWQEYSLAEDLAGENDGLEMDPCFDDFLSLGSEAVVAYMAQFRNTLNFSSFGVNMKDYYNSKYFDSSEGVYKFGLKLDYSDDIESFEDISLKAVPYSEGFINLTVKFDSNALLSEIVYDCMVQGEGAKITFTFTDYNKTVKPSSFPAFNI